MMLLFKRRPSPTPTLDPMLARAVEGLGTLTIRSATEVLFDNALSTGRAALENGRIVAFKRMKIREAQVGIGGWNEKDGWVWSSRIVRRDEKHIYEALLGE